MQISKMAPNNSSAKLPTSLFLKSLLVGTAVDDAAHELRWMLGAWRRHRYPELWEMYLEERRLPEILKRLLKPNSACIDVGCHIGSFLSKATRLAPKGHHVGFEASPTKAGWLKRRFPDAEIFCSAVGDRAGTIMFHENCSAPGLSFVSEDSNPLDHHVISEVALCRLDDVLSDRKNVDLVKIDVEGNELAVLRGAARLIESHRPAIIFEFGPENDGMRRTLYDWFSELNYSINGYADFLFDRGSLSFDEFRRCGVYPFRGMNFLARPK